MTYVSHGAVLGDSTVTTANGPMTFVQSAYDAWINHSVGPGPGGRLVFPNGDIQTFDGDGNPDTNIPHPGSGTFNDVDQNGVSEAQKAALYVKQGGPITEVAVAYSPGLDAQGKTIAVLDPSKAAAIQSLVNSDPWVAAQHAQSAAGNPESAAQLAADAARTRQSQLADAVAALLNLESIDRGEIIDPVDFVNHFLMVESVPALAPLTAAEAAAIAANPNQAPTIKATSVTVATTPPAQVRSSSGGSSSTSTGTSAPPAAPANGPSASSNYPLTPTSQGPSDTPSPSTPPLPVLSDAPAGSSSSSKLLLIAGGGAALLIGGLAIAHARASNNRRR